MAIQTTFSSEKEFIVYVQQFKPDDTIKAELSINDDGSRCMVFITPDQWVSGASQITNRYRHIMILPFQARPHNHYLPILAMRPGLQILRNCCSQIYELVILGKAYGGSSIEKTSINPICKVSHKKYHTIHLTCTQRLAILALCIALLVRSLIQVLSLGLLAGLFYPIDKLTDYCCALSCYKGPNFEKYSGPDAIPQQS